MGLRTLLDALTDLVVVASGDGRVLELGAAARAFLGDRVGPSPHLHDLAQVVDPTSRRELAEPVARALSTTGTWRGSVNLIELSGVSQPYIVTARLDPGGGLVIVARDTTDARARQAAEAESRSKDEFIAKLGHELRTPLNAMLGFAQLLELEPLPPELHEDVERIITGGRHMQSLIDDVLDLARLRAGRGDINKAPVNILDIVKGVVEFVEPLAERRGIRRIIHPAEPLVVDADRRRLWQVLLNLVSNALKYGREGGSVRVGIVPVTGGRVRIEVEDNGIGISQQALTKLFRPFERLGAEHSGIEGSGLGLALSHALVTAMGGVLTVASRPGVGSVFAVVLDAVDARYGLPSERGSDEYAADGLPGSDPYADDYADDPYADDYGEGLAGADPAAFPADRAAPEPAGLRVVHVSGDPALRAQVTETLADALGADTILVPRGALALATIRNARPALVLIDRNLPDTTAVDLLTRLASDSRAKSVPALVLSSDPNPDDRHLLRQSGAVDVLGLPLDTRTLVAAASALTTTA